MKIKVILKRTFSIVSIFLVTLIVSQSLNFFANDDSRSYTRIMIHQLDDSDENVDILFVGASHCYRALNPEIADGYFHATTFNAGSSGQFMDGSLAVIKEALKHNDVKKVFLDVSYSIIKTEKYKDRDSLTSTYILSDYMEPSPEKVDYLLNASSYKHYINSFFPAKRNADKLFDFSGVLETIQKKNTKEYKEYHWNKSFYNDEYYVDCGYVEKINTFEPEYISERAFGRIDSESLLNEKTDWMKSLYDIISFCKDKSIELTFFIAPDRENTIVGKGNYQDFYCAMKEYANKNDINLYDFNLCKESYFDSKNDSFFADEDHLNNKGAKEFTQLFSRFFTGGISEADLFYDSYDKKTEAMEPYVYGIAKSPNGTDEYQQMYLICNKEESVQCSVLVKPEGKEEYEVPIKKPNESFCVPNDSHGKIKVSWCRKEEMEKHKFEASY